MIALQSFKRYLQYEKRYSSHTIAAYVSDLNAMWEYLREVYDIGALDEVQPKHLRSWVVGMVGAKQSPRTINRKISSLRSFFRYQIRRGELAKDPTVKLRALKMPHRLPNYIQEDEASFLCQDIRDILDFRPMRDILILKTFYLTGIRKSELIHLTKKDIDLAKKCFRILGKGNKVRLVPFSEDYAEELRHYLAHCEETFPHVNYLFFTDKGRKLYPKLVYNLVRKYISGISTITQKGPHTLRHTFATHLSNRGAELNAVKDLLGHASLSATQVYTHNNIEKLKKAYQAHPKS